MGDLHSRPRRWQEALVRSLEDEAEVFRRSILGVLDRLFRLRFQVIGERRALRKLIARASAPEASHPSCPSLIRRQEDLLQTLEANLSALENQFDQAIHQRRDLVSRRNFVAEGERAADTLSNLGQDSPEPADLRRLRDSIVELEIKAATLSELYEVQNSHRGNSGQSPIYSNVDKNPLFNNE